LCHSACPVFEILEFDPGQKDKDYLVRDASVASLAEPASGSSSPNGWQSHRRLGIITSRSSGTGTVVVLLCSGTAESRGHSLTVGGCPAISRRARGAIIAPKLPVKVTNLLSPFHTERTYRITKFYPHVQSLVEIFPRLGGLSGTSFRGEDQCLRLIRLAAISYWTIE